MALTFIIIFSLFNNILNLPSPIKINSYNPFYITTNEVLFEFEYKSEEKTDIICIFKPYLNEIIFGKMEFFTNSEILKNKNTTNITESFYMRTFFFKRQDYITINSSDPFNLGKGNYYIHLIGNLLGYFEIFLINEIKYLELNNSYYFTTFFEHKSQNFHSLKIQNLTENIYMNLLLFNKSCSSFEITKNNEKIKCNSEIPNILLLEKNDEYLIKYNLDIFNYFAINFINYKTESIQSLNEQGKSFIPLSNSIFNYSIEIKNYQVNDYFGIIIDYPIKFSLQGDFLEKDNFEKFTTNVKNVGYNFFFTQKEIQSNFFIFKIKFFNDYYDKITIRKIDEIFFINKFPFSYNIQKGKVYLFLFSQELLNYFRNYNSYVKLKFEKDNSMNIILNSINKIFKDKIFVTKLDEINAISFTNIEKDGLFEISMMSENYNELINSNYLIGESEKTYLYMSNIGEKIEMISGGNKKKLFCNLISGNIDFYEMLDLSENKTLKKFNYTGLKMLNNQTLVLKLVINSYSIYEIFYQNYEKNSHFIGTSSKIIFFSKFVKYNIFSTHEDTKLGIKLLNQDSQLTLKFKEEKIILNSKNAFIEMDYIDEIEIEGNDSLVYFLVPLTNNSDYIISNSKSKDFKNIKDIFIVPEKTNHDIINLIITVTESDIDDIILYYLVDYNIIPFSRNKIDLMTKITLKKKKKQFILINNFLKNDKMEHFPNETFFIYLSFENNVSISYELKYSNYHILQENNQILISPGLNKIYIGYENDNYLKFDKCGEQNIYLSIYQNEEINRRNIIISEKNDLISCTKNGKDGYLSIEVNSEENFLISLSHQNMSTFDNIIYNYDIELSIDENEKNVVINYYPISNFPQIEYHIFIINQTYYNNLTDHCFINKYINDIYIKKYMFLSNGEEEMFSQHLNITNTSEIKCNEVYSFLIIAKEVIIDYPNYHYYNPKNFLINDSICNDKAKNSTEIGEITALPTEQNSINFTSYNTIDTSTETTISLSDQNTNIENTVDTSIETTILISDQNTNNENTVDTSIETTILISDQNTIIDNSVDISVETSILLSDQNTIIDNTVVTSVATEISPSDQTTIINNNVDTSIETEISPSDQTIINISSYFILGTDKFYYNINIKKVTFNFFIYKIEKESFPNNIYLYIITYYKKNRNLENDENGGETIKSKCKIELNDIKNQIKYGCEFDTNGEEISNVKSLDIIESNSQKYEIQRTSFLHSLYKNNIQNAKDYIFNKPLYILEDSIINYSDEEFNITGNLNEDDFNDKKLLLQFHSDNNNEEIIKSNCWTNKLDEKKYILKCNPDEAINTFVVDGYSNFEDGNLIVMFHNEKNKIETKNTIIKKPPESSSGKSFAILIAIIVPAIVIIVGAIVIIVCIKKRKAKYIKDKDKDKDKSSFVNTTFNINETSSTNK